MEASQLFDLKNVKRLTIFTILLKFVGLWLKKKLFIIQKFMKVNVNLLNGGVKYDTPTCELIELDTTATLCQASGFGSLGAPGNDLLEQDFGVF